MPTEALRCPTCGANDSSRPDAFGFHTCTYCGVRYRITSGQPRPATVGANVGTGGDAAKVPVWVRVLIAGVLVVGLGILAFMVPARRFYIQEPADPPPPPAKFDVTTLEKAPVLEVPKPVVLLPSTQALEHADAPAVARFVMDHRRPSAGASFYAVGFVSNASPFTIDRPKITAVMKDAKGVEIATAFGYADDPIPAGQKVPVQVLVSDPPAFATIDFEIVAKKATYVAAAADGITLESGPVQSGRLGNGFGASGKLVHGGTARAKFVRIQILAYDASDKLLGVDQTYADIDVLEPGGTARWNAMMLPYAETPARWEMTVSAQAAR